MIIARTKVGRRQIIPAAPSAQRKSSFCASDHLPTVSVTGISVRTF